MWITLWILWIFSWGILPCCWCGVIKALFKRLRDLQVPSAEEDVLLYFGKSLKEHVTPEIRVLVWNVQKGLGREEWQKDIRELAQGHEILILQEANVDEFSEGVWRSLSEFEMAFATSFLSPMFRTGVLTASHFPSGKHLFLQSEGREPISVTPKVALFSYYAIKNSSQSLLIANIHALNFNFNRPFLRQMQMVFETLETHSGPLILAGDFNTWNRARMRFLEGKSRELGLSSLEFQNDRRWLVLDHIFYRGMRLTDAHVHHDVRSSDHFPLSVKFNLT